MALDPGKQDRSYQFGRLLAVMEKAERDTYGTNENREPNAIRQMSVFCRRPMYVTANLEKQGVLQKHDRSDHGRDRQIPGESAEPASGTQLPDGVLSPAQRTVSEKRKRAE